VRIAALLALSCLVFSAAGAARAEDEPNAAELAASSIERAFGGTRVEIWRSLWKDQEITYGIARRWNASRPEVQIQVFEPRRFAGLAFLIRRLDNGAPGIEYYHAPKVFPNSSKTGRTFEIEVASPLEHLPFAPGLPPLVDFWPERASDFQFARLDDEEVSGKPCRVLLAHLRHSEGDYDTIVTKLARDSGLALETQYLLGKHLVRRVTVLPTDIDRSQTRPVVRKRTVERTGEADQILTLENFNLDPVFPDQFFTSSNLRTGRFPSY
jgi:hypothetical protein